ncbi:extracellular solute-binding protein [bacterium]|nr:MAG: extracellular solute-binding protein [bacterium]
MKRLFLLGAAPVLAVFLAGCPATPPSQTASNGAAGTSDSGTAKTLTIISPHNRAIQVEFGDLWKKSHPETELKWIDQGGSSDDLRFVREQFARRSKQQGIGIDVFFGGGGETFSELEGDGLLVPITAKSDVPDELNKVPLRGKDSTWVGAALSGFGILYNKQIATRDKLPVPQSWVDLGNPKLADRIELADPRKSGSAHVVYEIILQTNGWDKGWKILTSMAGNARRWMSSSSEPLQDVQNGEAVFCTAIDFYATNAIDSAGPDKLAYIQPAGQNLITPDPIGILQGAPNAEVAQKFVEFVLSPEAQKLWITKKGAAGGPTNSTLSRLPASPAAYGGQDSFTTTNPYKEKVTIAFDSEKASKRRRALDDLIGAVLVDNATAVQDKWRKTPDMEKSGYVPMPEAAFDALAAKWGDAATVTTQKQKWSADAQKFFGS